MAEQPMTDEEATEMSKHIMLKQIQSMQNNLFLIYQLVKCNKYDSNDVFNGMLYVIFKIYDTDNMQIIEDEIDHHLIILRTVIIASTVVSVIDKSEENEPKYDILHKICSKALDMMENTESFSTFVNNVKTLINDGVQFYEADENHLEHTFLIATLRSIYKIRFQDKVSFSDPIYALRAAKEKDQIKVVIDAICNNVYVSGPEIDKKKEVDLSTKKPGRKKAVKKDDAEEDTKAEPAKKQNKKKAITSSNDL